MNHPLFCDTVTLYKRDGEKYTRYILRGVQWRQKVERLVSNVLATQGTMMYQTSTAITIPHTITAAKQISPVSGDVLVLGIGPEITADYTIAHLRADNITYCTVRAVVDHTQRPKLKHWKVIAA